MVWNYQNADYSEKNKLIVLFIYYDSRHTVVPYDVSRLVVYEELTSGRFYCRSSRGALYETTLIASSREKRRQKA